MTAPFRVMSIAGDSPPRLNVVLLHGYSMSVDDLAPFASSLGLAAAFHFPQAPLLCDEGGHSWWPIDTEARGKGPRDLFAAHPPGRDAVRAALHATLVDIAAQSPGLPIVLGGFSQGAMLSCDYLLQHHAVPVAALTLLSGSRLAFDEWRPRLQRLQGLPTFVSHGMQDDDLAFSAGSALEAALQQAGARTTWVPFEGGHEIPLIVWRRLKKFLLDVIVQPLRAP